MRLDFAEFLLGPPLSNTVVECTDTGTPATDTLTLLHSAGETTRAETTLLCGLNTGYHGELTKASSRQNKNATHFKVSEAAL